MTQYTVEIGETEEESGLYDVEISDTFNPFGNYAVLYIKDQGGERYDKYPRGTRVDIYEDQTGSVEPRFTGFSVERHEYEENGADILEVDVYSFDQFLRGTKVSTHTDGLTIADALEQIITEDTPVSWNANKVSVGDNHTLTRDYRGKSVEETVIELTYKSENEEFGVDQDLDFFFQERETQSAPRDIDNTQWFHHDIPEEGKEAVNEVTIWFNGGDESVTIDKGDDKLDEQESLGLDVPPANTLEKTFEDITDIDDARDKGEQILDERSASQTGEVVTYGLEGAKPGDLINVEIESRGIDDEFVIAGLHYEWGVDETTVTIIRKTGHQDDVLVRLADSVEKVEMRPADRDAIENRVTETEVSAVIDIAADVGPTVFDDTRFTNTGRRKLRDGWRGEGTIDITEIAVGSDGSNLSRSNTGLESETTRTTVTESLDGSTGVSYSASFTQSDVAEVGLFDAQGDLIVRAVGESASVDNTVSVDLAVSNEDVGARGLFTTSGVESVRDIIADNSPNLPTQYAYGSGGTDPTVSDTALENQVIVLDLENILIQNANDATSWESLIDIEDTDPLTVENEDLELLQTSFTADGDEDNQTDFDGYLQKSDYSGKGIDDETGMALALSEEGDTGVWEFDTNYTIPESSVGVHIRLENDGGTPETSFYLNNTHLTTIQGDNSISRLILKWNDLADDGNSWVDNGYNGGDLEPGTHTVRAEVTETYDGYTAIDAVALVDMRYVYNFDEDPTWTSANINALDGPEHYPDSLEVKLDQAGTRREVTEASLESAWNDTSNNQFIEVANDPDGEGYLRFDNTDSFSTTFQSPSTNVDLRFGLSRFPMDTARDDTPRYGYNGQSVDYFDLFANVDAITRDGTGLANVRAIVQPGSITGTTLREGGQLASDDTLLTRSVFAEFTVGDSMRIISSETVEFGNP